MKTFLSLFWSIAFVASSVRLAVPIMVAAVGESISQRAGVMNIGLEGMMLAGALGGVLGADATHSAWIGLLVAMLVAMLMALPHGYISINLGGDQVVSGVAINLVALGLTSFVNREVFGVNGHIVAHFNAIHIPVLSNIPVLGPALFREDILTYLAPLLAVAVWLLMFKSRWGLHWRASGEDPEGLDSIGVSVAKVRWQALMLCAALAGLAGAAISLGQVYTFVDNMTSGRGFVALALVIAARWNPLWAVAISLLFGGAVALSLRVQASNITAIPVEITLMLPYLLTLVVYAFAARSGRVPRALGRPFVKQ